MEAPSQEILKRIQKFFMGLLYGAPKSLCEVQRFTSEIT